MKPQPPQPVKLFVGLLYHQRDSLAQLCEALAERFSPIDYQSCEYEFALTGYYADEMGQPLHRQFLSFLKLIDPGEIAGIKIATNQLEDEMAGGKNRPVNVDPGYMDFHKVVLASAKYNGQKIYLAQGIYADPALRYAKGKFIAYGHTFPDFKVPLYHDTFLHIRSLYKEQLNTPAAPKGQMM
jgi:hypothetical protein